ncbi:LPS export ABC transporter permease LptF [Paracoccus sp. (in: a-proteobacteria)]|uniref:LPS export ABC transporter permease LptF n=1 Tax=Paracoccus sp. TaxID=267 RepID=UPI003A855F2D
MSRIDRYILSQFLTLFGFFALVLVSVYWINRAVRMFDRLIGDGQSALVVLEFTALTLPAVIAVVLPITAFVAAAYATNRMAGESEIVVMQSAGLTPWRMARPVLIYGLLIAALVAVLTHALVPTARARLSERQNEIAQTVTTRSIRPGTFQYPAPNVTVFVRSIEGDGRLLDVLIEDARLSEEQITYTAKEAFLVAGDGGPVLVLRDGMSQNLRQIEGQPQLSVTRFAQISYDVTTMFGGSGRGEGGPRDKPTWRLLQDRSATSAPPQRAEIEREIHNRTANSLMAPCAALIGFATLLIGGYSRFGVWRQISVASLLLIGLQLASNVVSGRVQTDPAQWPLLYLPIALGALISVMLLHLASRPWRRPSAGAGS